MIALINKYKSVLRFILTFIGSYLLLYLAYQGYLKYGPNQQFYPDIATHLVALQCESVLDAVGYDVSLEPNKMQPAMNIVYDGSVIVRVVEGCNALSIMLLFIAFIISFYDGLKKTILFIFGGIAFIYGMNIVRIVLLTVGVIKYPEYTDFLHTTAFPAVLYGSVFLLWMGWIRAYKKSPDE